MSDFSQPRAARADDLPSSDIEADETLAGLPCLAEIGSIPSRPSVVGHRHSFRRDSHWSVSYLGNVWRANAAGVDEPGEGRARSNRSSP